MFKELLNAIHNTLHSLFHIVLIPVVTGLKALDAGIQHLLSEITKV